MVYGVTLSFRFTVARKTLYHQNHFPIPMGYFKYVFKSGICWAIGPSTLAVIVLLQSYQARDCGTHLNPSAWGLKMAESFRLSWATQWDGVSKMEKVSRLSSVKKSITNRARPPHSLHRQESEHGHKNAHREVGRAWWWQPATSLSSVQSDILGQKWDLWIGEDLKDSPIY